MHSSVFFKLFPPPRFMMMKYAGLDISDDAIRCLGYESGKGGAHIGVHASVDLPPGLIQDGDIKDEAKLGALLKDFERGNGLSYVKVSLPEEKVYLFQTEVPTADIRAIRQNIESKLEENVPLSAPDAVFYFDLVPAVPGEPLRASVSVSPRAYLEKCVALLRGAGMVPVAFETAPKSIARAVVPLHSEASVMIVHIMAHKTGIFIVSGGVVSFTFTLGEGGQASSGEARTAYIDSLKKEINRIYAYWASHDSSRPGLSEILLVGGSAPSCEAALQNAVIGATVPVPVHVADVWRNILDVNRYVPPVSRDQSLDYAVAVGLAMDL